jgi:hypothetical protein
MTESTSTSAPKPRPAAVGDLLGEPLRIGEPSVAGALAVFPVFGPEPRRAYVAFAQGRERGVRVLEVQERPSVNELVIENPSDLPVLLYEGEEVLGSQQNRIFEISVLVPARSRVTVPVSCVEAGRWERARRTEELAPAPQCAHPSLRSMKAARRAARLGQRLAAGLEAMADQGEVWAAVSAKSARHGAVSPTGAMHDIYESRRSALEAIRRAIRLHPGQTGAIVAIGGRLVVLDYVSRPEAFAALHGRLVQGYALDALEAEAGEPPAIEAASGFALLVSDSAVARRTKSIGLGDEIRFASNGVAGSALAVDGELVQLTAFPGEEPGRGRRRRF